MGIQGWRRSNLFNVPDKASAAVKVVHATISATIIQSERERLTKSTLRIASMVRVRRMKPAAMSTGTVGMASNVSQKRYPILPDPGIPLTCAATSLRRRVCRQCICPLDTLPYVIDTLNEPDL